MAKVTVKNVYKIYPGEKGPDVTAVDDVSLEVGDREFVVLVGPSGCGKSTTLRMIAGLEEISKGDIYIGERRVNDVAPKDRDIAMVFQNYALYPHMTVYDNLAFGLKLRKYPRGRDSRHRGFTRTQTARAFRRPAPKSSGGKGNRAAAEGFSF
jgi:multiple sugar transport system ATP-binding protein